MARLLAFFPLIAVALAGQTPPRAPLAPVPALAPVPPLAPMAMQLDQLNRQFDNIRYNVDYSGAYSNLTEAYSNIARSYSDFDRFEVFDALGSFGRGGPVAWAQQDPADSLYRSARDQLNRGDYRKAADLFKALPSKFPASAYVGDAQYWQAFALYRMGSTSDLQEALTVLEAFKRTTPPADADAGTRRAPVAISGGTRGGIGGGGGNGAGGSSAVGVSSSNGSSYPVSRVNSANWSRRGEQQTDVDALAARIATVLASRGMGENATVKRVLAAAGTSCDTEDQSVREAALEALMENDPDAARQSVSRILATKDECSSGLRRRALGMLSDRRDATSTAQIINAAKSDPSNNVRYAAMSLLASHPSPDGIQAMIEILHSSNDPAVSRMAVMTLGSTDDAKARSEVRAVIENASTDPQLRGSAIDAMTNDHMAPDDVAWLRGFYGRATDDRMRERVIYAVSRAGGDLNNQWIAALVRNENESLESRSAALRAAGRAMDVSTLIKLYDASSERPLRETVIQLLSERKEPEALDKIVDIAKTGTDPSMRRVAIGVLARSKDPRASKLLLQLVDK